MSDDTSRRREPMGESGDQAGRRTIERIFATYLNAMPYGKTAYHNSPEGHAVMDSLMNFAEALYDRLRDAGVDARLIEAALRDALGTPLPQAQIEAWVRADGERMRRAWALSAAKGSHEREGQP